MSSSPSAGKAAAAHGLDLNFAATAFEHRESSPEAASNPLVDIPGGSVSETLSRADGPKAGDGSSGGAKDGILGGGDRGLNQSAEAEDSFVDAKPDFEEGDGVAGKGVQEADSRTTGDTLTTAVDVVRTDLNLAVPVVEAESLDRNFVEEKAGDEGGSGDFVAADVRVVKGVNAAKAKSTVMPPVDGKVKDKDVVMADVGVDVVMANKNAEGDSKLGVEISAFKVVEIAKSPASLPNVLKCQDVFPGNDGSCQKTEVVQMLEVDEKVPQVKDNMDGFDMDRDSNAVQNVQVGGQEILKSREKQRPWTSDVENSQHVRYYYAFQDEKKDGFSVLDMVWGKVRSHPWWPGQIFDPSDASEMALKHEKKDHFLVAYFGDKTFAWCDESRLKPFQTYFSHMEKQSSLDAFATAINDALGEVSRRIELGMMCHCITDDACADMKHQKVENAGIQEGTCSPAVDSSLIASSFQPEKFLEYIQALAQFPNGEADSLELLIAKAQLRSFYRSKGYTELPVFVIGGGLENDVETTPARKRKSDYDVADLSTPVFSDSISGRGKRGRGRPPKQKNILEDGRKQKSLSELMEEKHVPHHGDSGRSGSGARASSCSSGRNIVIDSDSTGSRKIKKKRLDLLGDLETKSRSPSHKRYSKVGESMHRVASRMEGSPLILRKRNSETFQKSPAKVNGRGDDVVDDTHTHVETPKRKRGASKDFPSPSEMLSQLFLAARDPMKGYSFLALIVSFFTDFRDSLASSSFKDKKLVEVVRGKRGRRKLINSTSASAGMFQPDLVQDSYWSDVIFSESPEKETVSSDQKTEGESQTKRQKKKRKPEEQPLPSVPSGLVVDTPQHLQVDLAGVDNGEEVAAERPMNNLVENTEECMPTALILSFTESDALPSESDLISIFGRYGSLREAETEVLKKANRAKVVFKRRADAEVAFSSAGKYSIFGPALVSYRLRYLPSTPKTSPSSTPRGKKDAFPTEGVNLEVSAQEDPRAVDDMHAEPQGNGSSE
ncbi:PWWP domain-containing protein 5 [Elaeis guineensis]|uniref:Uncharacterized protein LOC105044657 n=1 Tax=Elaeis guineensis var. tenera TaxID=51953 RepID=A0A6I9R7C5_ELAGV|nr:uncharacterized protein LOC105044657 [Elaeis guineensis]